MVYISGQHPMSFKLQEPHTGNADYSLLLIILVPVLMIFGLYTFYRQWVTINAAMDSGKPAQGLGSEANTEEQSDEEDEGELDEDEIAAIQNQNSISDKLAYLLAFAWSLLSCFVMLTMVAGYDDEKSVRWLNSLGLQLSLTFLCTEPAKVGIKHFCGPTVAKINKAYNKMTGAGGDDD
jgi:hypothetical protein